MDTADHIAALILGGLVLRAVIFFVFGIDLLSINIIHHHKGDAE